MLPPRSRRAGEWPSFSLGDLVDPAISVALIEAAVARFGRLNVLVSNAGFADRTPMADLTDAAFTRSMDTIGLAFLRLARAAVPHLRTAQDPRIVAVSSFVAHTFRTDMPAFAASAASKAALEALVRALSLELAVSRGDGERRGSRLHPQGLQAPRRRSLPPPCGRNSHASRWDGWAPPTMSPKPSPSSRRPRPATSQATY